MRVGYVQTNPRILMVKENIDEVVELVRGADADLIVLPELFSTGYSLTQEELAGVSEEVEGGPTIDRIGELSREMGIGIVGGFAEKSGGRFYNSSFLVTPENLHIHRKVHLFGKEKRIFAAGDGFEVHEFRDTIIGMMVCFDWFFPESCRTLMLKGAEIIAHPANLVLPFWPSAAPTRAVENHVFIVTSSRIGIERGLEFVGGSLIATPGGEILSSSGDVDLGCSVVEIDPGEARDKRVTPLNDIVEDRMPGAYELG
jgi:predicted amidohydrolase